MFNTSKDAQGHQQAPGGAPSDRAPVNVSEFVDSVVDLGEPVLVKAGMRGADARRLLTDALVEVTGLPRFSMQTIYWHKPQGTSVREALRIAVARRAYVRLPAQNRFAVVDLVKAIIAAIATRINADGKSQDSADELASAIAFGMWDLFQCATLYISGNTVLRVQERDAALWTEYHDESAHHKSRPKTHARVSEMAARHDMSERGLYKSFRRHRATLGIEPVQRGGRGPLGSIIDMEARNRDMWRDYTSTAVVTSSPLSPERLQEVASKYHLACETVRQLLSRHLKPARDTTAQVNLKARNQRNQRILADYRDTSTTTTRPLSAKRLQEVAAKHQLSVDHVRTLVKRLLRAEAASAKCAAITHGTAAE